MGQGHDLEQFQLKPRLVIHIPSVSFYIFFLPVLSLQDSASPEKEITGKTKKRKAALLVWMAPVKADLTFESSQLEDLFDFFPLYVMKERNHNSISQGRNSAHNFFLKKKERLHFSLKVTYLTQTLEK
jgi:hypothetical protein